uniref:Bone morphogenetic protein Bmp2/4 n=1 Tax=Meara stichopi TaxID=84115 RepID=A0A2P1DVA0_9BILA|nr:bone morphogenetic protein Bmp2/4 [Meara stichopi]
MKLLHLIVVTEMLLTCISAVHCLLPERAKETLQHRPEMMEKLEARLLRMFGMDVSPHPARKVHISRHMRTLYDGHLKFTEEYADDGDLHLSFDNHYKNSQSPNTVRGFHATVEHVDGNTHNLWFQIDDFADVPVSAELRISHEFGAHLARVSVYDIVKADVGLVTLLDTKLVETHDRHHVTLDIFPAVLRWLQTPTAGHGLQIHLSDSLSEVSGSNSFNGLLGQLPTSSSTTSELLMLSHSETPSSKVRIRRFVDEDSQSFREQNEPIVLLYTHDVREAAAKPLIQRRATRNAQKRRNKKKQKSKFPLGKWRNGKTLFERARSNCKRYQFPVIFSEVNWDDWIVVPMSYDAFVCHGVCKFPLPNHLNATNHAIVQTLVNSYMPGAAPPACCIPTDLNPMMMLYVNDKDNVILKNYDNMIVNACGCR